MMTTQEYPFARRPAAGIWLHRGEALAVAAAHLARGVKQAARGLNAALARAQARGDAKRALYALDDRMLQDIGLRRDQIAGTVDTMFRNRPAAEAARPSPDAREGRPATLAAGDASNDRQFASAA